jgi:hypothetical protein
MCFLGSVLFFPSRCLRRSIPCSNELDIVGRELGCHSTQCTYHILYKMYRCQ